ncbi:hypothetical protein CP8484711_0910B, partial [Chlamydia psittaci 84-8471/1]|jgi:hypothetical protein
LLF